MVDFKVIRRFNGRDPGEVFPARPQDAAKWESMGLGAIVYGPPMEEGIDAPPKDKAVKKPPKGKAA